MAVCESYLTRFLDFLWDYRDIQGTKIVHTKLGTNTRKKKTPIVKILASSY
jgi:hypothetical protein